jgi:outer membrane scaffolding protein for murein synthesis (MipA/OmpV family)
MYKPTVLFPRFPAKFVFFWGLFLAGLTPAAHADQHPQPLWEIGAMVGVGVLPTYPAADQTSFKILPLPYFTYRGEVIRSDDKGLLRGRLFKSDRAEIDISLSGTFDVNSADNRARAGMPDLDWLGEIGPRLEFTLARAGDVRIEFELPVRGVFSTNFGSRFNYEGLIAVPELAYQHDDFLGSDAKFKIGVSAAFANAELQSLFYEVPTAYATATRPAYVAKSGYMGSKLQISASRRFGPRIRILSALRFDFYKGAANDKSPLFKDSSTVTLGIAIIVSLWQSKTLVQN